MKQTVDGERAVARGDRRHQRDPRRRSETSVSYRVEAHETMTLLHGGAGSRCPRYRRWVSRIPLPLFLFSVQLVKRFFDATQPDIIAMLRRQRLQMAWMTDPLTHPREFPKLDNHTEQKHRPGPENRQSVFLEMGIYLVHAVRPR